MNKNLTEMIFVVDRSGSMHYMSEEASQGINKLIEEQTKEDGECRVTLVQFDTAYEFVENGTDIKSVKPYNLIAGGMTALNDAVGRTIDEVGLRLSKTEEKDRPGLVLFCIVTDGIENASREYSAEQVYEKITHQQKVYNWQFTYLGANQDSFKAAKNMGINTIGTSNYSNIKAAYEGTSGKFSRMRNKSKSHSLSPEDNSYTEAEVRAMVNP